MSRKNNSQKVSSKNTKRLFCGLKIVGICCAVVLFVLAIGLIVIVTSNQYVTLDIDKIQYSTKLTILDGKGEKVNLSNDYFQEINYESLNQHTIDAFICAEDKRFFSHNGIDTRSIFRALFNNLAKGEIAQGGSTITQQLIKNTLLTSERTLKRKLNEALLSLQLEKKASKEQILEWYLNKIYFGGPCYGLASASKYYFDTCAENLSISQSATLACLLKSPNNYSPFVNIDKCLQQRNITLNTMFDEGKITQEQFLQAKSEQIQLNQKETTNIYQDYIEATITQACQMLNLSPSQLMSGNYVIQTFLDNCIQKQTEQTISDNVDKNSQGVQRFAMLSDNKTGGIVAYYGQGSNNFYTQKRSIGSTAKPLVAYAPALEEGILNTMSVILDDKTDFSGYTPSNSSGKYYGWVTAKTALAKSLNTCAVNVTNSVGLNKSKNYLAKKGIVTTEQDSLLMSLGSFEKGISIDQLCSAYSTFATKGQFVQLKFIQSISKDGLTIYENNGLANPAYSEQTAYLVTDMLKEVVQNGTAKSMRNLPFEVACKTGTVGDKDGNTDALTCGYTTNHTFCVWYSTQDGKMSNEISGSYSAKVTAQLLDKIYSDSPPSNFEIPSDVFLIEIDADQLNMYGKCVKANETSPNKIAAFFSLKNMPVDRGEIKQNYHLQANVDTEGMVKISCTAVPSHSYLFRLDNDGKMHNLGKFNGQFVDNITQEGNFYYQLYTILQDKQHPLSSKVSVYVPPQNSKLPDENLNDDNNVNKIGKDSRNDNLAEENSKKDNVFDEIIDKWFS